MKVSTRFLLAGLALLTASIAGATLGCTASTEQTGGAARIRPLESLPHENFSRPAEKPHDPNGLVFNFDQLDYHYRAPGEFTHRLTGDQYGFQALSFIITDTYPGGGPGLHVHDTEEAHVLLEGTAEYRVGDDTFTVHAPYVARVPAGVPHTFINAGNEPFHLIAVFASNHPVTNRIGPNPLIPGQPNQPVQPQ